MEGLEVRRSLLAVFACLSAFLIAAAPPAFSPIPTVIVYPLSGSSAALDREANSRIATLLATQIAIGGTVRVIPARVDVDRADFLADARKNGADYYVTGFITPLGSGASIVDQVVSTTSGTLVFSVSNFISSYAEVQSAGDQLREGIVERASRGIAAFAAPPAAPATPQPEPSQGTNFNVNNLFGHKKNAAAIVAAAPPPSSVVAILTVGGSAGADARAAAAQALVTAFAHAGRTAVLANVNVPAATVCSANKAVAQIASWVDAPGATASLANASLRMIAYDCGGMAAFDRTYSHRGAGLEPAITAAVTDAVNGYLAPPKGR